MRQHCHTVFVMGHSMGAVLAAHLATHHTADVRGLVLIAPCTKCPTSAFA
ncbi:MAG: alpha/beta fold hydrolase [Chloroflexi bacterium]|nr:alpha/beta fold hydrolase [Chloroflexota bacterium]